MAQGSSYGVEQRISDLARRPDERTIEGISGRSVNAGWHHNWPSQTPARPVSGSADERRTALIMVPGKPESRPKHKPQLGSVPIVRLRRQRNV
jgi:hypothetical protein